MYAVIFFYPMFPAMPDSPFANFLILKNLLLASNTFNNNHAINSYIKEIMGSGLAMSLFLFPLDFFN